MANFNLKGRHSLILVLVASTVAALGQSSQSAEDPAKPASAPTAPAQGAEEPADSRPNPPTVICSGGQLTISTNNSTLASVLAEVHKCIGAKIDMPEKSATSRLFDKLGPGPAREVLSSLLAATGFDYVIGSSESNPDKVESILLMARAIDAPSAARADSALTPARRAYLLMRQGGRSDAVAAENPGSASAAESDSSAKEGVGQVPTENAGTNANQASAGDQVPAAVSPDPVAAQNSSLSPRNVSPSPAPAVDTNNPIADMEKLFEQRRQMMQNQNSKPPQ